MAVTTGKEDDLEWREEQFVDGVVAPDQDMETYKYDDASRQALKKYLGKQSAVK